MHNFYHPCGTIIWVPNRIPWPPACLLLVHDKFKSHNKKPRLATSSERMWHVMWSTCGRMRSNMVECATWFSLVWSFSVVNKSALHWNILLRMESVIRLFRHHNLRLGNPIWSHYLQVSICPLFFSLLLDLCRMSDYVNVDLFLIFIDLAFVINIAHGFILILYILLADKGVPLALEYASKYTSCLALIFANTSSQRMV